MIRRSLSSETTGSTRRRSTVHLSRQRDVARSPRHAGGRRRRRNIRIRPARPTFRQRQRANRYEHSDKELEMNKHLRENQVSSVQRFVVTAAVGRIFPAKHGDPDHG